MQPSLAEMTASAADGQGAAHPKSVPAGRLSSRIVMDIVALADVGALLLAAMVTGLWHAGMQIVPVGNTLIRLEFCLIIIAVTVYLLRLRGEYFATRHCTIAVKPVSFALTLAGVMLVTLAVAQALGANEAWPVSWLPLWWSLSVALVALERRMASRHVERLRSRGAFRSTLAVYGSGRIAQRLVEIATGNAEGVHLVGIYDDRQAPERRTLDDPVISGGIGQLIAAGRQDLIDEIIVALPPAADGRLSHIIRQLEHLPVRLRVCTHLASDYLQADIGQHRVSALGAVGLLDVKSKPMADWAPVLKRVLDYAVAVPALLALTPLFIIIAMAIRLDSPGPVFFRQRRHGLNHRVFPVLKFRTMRVTEDGAKVTQATKDDPRVTRVGKWLRKTSFDELPQLINIVTGDMALVGPRPHALVHNEHYGEILERYANRHQVKPGLTGWAQINGFRGETQTPEAMRQRVEHDLWYIDNWSLLLDLRILALTPIYGFTHRNAY